VDTLIHWFMTMQTKLQYPTRQGNRWKRGMLPKCLLSIKGRSCNQTLLVHQDMTKKNTFYEKT